ncbi:putative DNA helicase ino80 [Coemansia sp. RSA 988]|nr:putative DNA helicase ino80 [Coemansia sp. RSA 988]
MSRSPANPHSLNSLLSTRDESRVGAAREPVLEQNGAFPPPATSYMATDATYQQRAAFGSPPQQQPIPRHGEYSRYDGGYDYPQHDYARPAPQQQYAYAEGRAAQYADYRDGYDYRDQVRAQQPTYGYEYEHDHVDPNARDPRDQYDGAVYANDRRQYAYPDGVSGEYYYRQQYEYPAPATYRQDVVPPEYTRPSSTAVYYDEQRRYDYQQRGALPSTHSPYRHAEALRSPNQTPHVHQKYAAPPSGRYVYDMPPSADQPVDAAYQAPQSAVVDATQLAPYRRGTEMDSPAMRERLADLRFHRTPVSAAYPTEADYRSPASGTHTQVFQRNPAYDSEPKHPAEMDQYADERGAYADRSPAPGRRAGIGITSLLSDAPIDSRGQDRDHGAYDRYGDYSMSSRYNRDYNETEVEGYYPSTHPAEPTGMMSISQLVGGDTGAGGGHEYARGTVENATRPSTYGMRTPPSRATQGAVGYMTELSPDVPLAKQAWAIVVTDDDSALEHGHLGVADDTGKAAVARAELVSDDEDRPLATQADIGDMSGGESRKPPTKRRRRASKGGHRSRSTTKASLADHDAAEYTATTTNQSAGRRRQPRRLRNGKKLELSREYVYDEDDDDEDDEDVPLGQNVDNQGEGRYPLDISGEQDVAVPGSHMMDVPGAHALPADDYSVDEKVQAYVHHVKQRTDRAIAKYEERAKRKSQRMHEHVVQRYGPYLGDYFEKTGERPEYEEAFLDNGYHRVNYGELEHPHESRGNGHVHARHRDYENGYGDDIDYPLSGLARNSLRPPPMGYFPPSRPLSPAGYEFGHGRDDTPRSAGSEPLALLASEEAVSRAGRYYEQGERGEHKSFWAYIATEQVPRAHRHMVANIQVRNANMRKVVQLCQREVRRVYGLAPTRTIQLNPQQPILVQRPPKELLMRSRRSMREMLMFWKRYEKEEREMRKRAEREAAERQKQEEEAREARRQARKLNFLITQTELYSHFVGSKIGEGAKTENEQEAADGAGAAAEFKTIDFDNADDAALTAHARQSAQDALAKQQAQARAFDGVRQIQQNDEKDASADVQDASVADALDTMDFQEPQTLGGPEIAQPHMLMCQLKEYQLKGLNWLANLYEQGINGILADEMGLGKTVQSISLLAYLAETHNIWGPFMVVAPASTLHNWQQELARFVPEFKVLPYWGSPKDRKVLRKSLWNPKSLSRKDSAFHVLVTSYQLVITDESYLNRVKWQYMVLDEAQAIKSSASTRWKTLLGFRCRNRLLLTGTPIQNSMQELWALLHFIMPTLFDSHEEFSEWFSRDIEAHAENRSMLNKHQLFRLHMILKPFMLRRNKRHVQHELGEKIEKLVECDLTKRQKDMYRGLMSKISLTELLQHLQSGSGSGGKDDANENLMNLVMQFRKVCSHPELFERAEVDSPFVSGTFPTTGSLLREGDVISCSYATRSLVSFTMPKLLYRDSLETPRKLTARQDILNKLTLWSPLRISEDHSPTGLFSLLRLCAPSVGQAVGAFHDTLEKRLDDIGEDDARPSSLWQSLQADNDGAPPPARSAALQGLQPGSVLHALTNVFSPRNLSVSPNLAGLARITQSKFAHSYMGMVTPAYKPAAVSPPVDFMVSDRSAAWEHSDMMLRNPLAKRLSCGRDSVDDWSRPFLSQGLTDIWMPSKDKLIRYSGKMAVLDKLLTQLKQGGHRVLLYFQMTKMIDLFEDYLAYRKYTYLRLDGSSKISDRRDMVMDWQTRDDIFIFLLTTRAGGLGINLTAADTVIFFESDWNPTVDSQAMDRAHRLGQTKQVTVYRLITRGTIEERILQRAKQKDEIHRIVIAGGDAKNASEGAAAAAEGGAGSEGLAEDLSTDAQPSSKEIMSWLLGETADDESAARSGWLSMERMAQETSNRIYGDGGYPGPLDMGQLGHLEGDIWSQLVPLPPPNVHDTQTAHVEAARHASLDSAFEAAIWQQQREAEQRSRVQHRQRGRGRGARGGGQPREKRKARASKKDGGSVAGSRTDTPEPTSKRIRINNGASVASSALIPGESEAGDTAPASTAVSS